MGRITGVLVVLAVTLLPAAAAHAAFPGENGRIAFERGGDIWTISPDGTGATNLTNTAGPESDPSWSPDGMKIAFDRGEPAPCYGDISVMNADGTGRVDYQIQILPPFSGVPCSIGHNPAWSPDGSQIAFGEDDDCDFGGVWRVNADGTSPVHIVTACDGQSPSWSPDGNRIAFSFYDNGSHVWTMNPDGSSLTAMPYVGISSDDRDPNWSPDNSKLVFRAGQVTGRIWTAKPGGTGATDLGFSADDPAWSPDGKKIVLVAYSGGGIQTVNADGTGLATIPNTATGTEPDWQPILRGYARPKAATPLYTSLVPAYEECTAPNRQHASPLSFNSCNPPVQTSHFATVGTPDANSQPAKSVGSLKLLAIGEVPINTGNGNQSDINIDFSLTDVRDKTTPANDYAGGLRAKAELQITDRNNTPYPGGPGPGTVIPISFEFNVPCATTPSDSTVGSTCALSTTANTLVPGQVLERQRAIWQLGTVEVDDGGTDGNPSTAGDNTLFATQGVFIP